MPERPIARKWKLVRKTSIARNLRHLLLILMHYQDKNESAWCKRETLADELGVKVDVVSQQMKELEAIGVVERVWKSRNNRPSRQYTIRFSELARHQRTLRDSSDCDAPILSESSRSPLANPQGQSEESLRHEEPVEEPIEEPSSRPNRFADSDMQTAEFIWKLITDMQPGHKRPNLQTWANIVRLTRERDNRTDDQIRELFAWANSDSFWRKNILSPDKLRKQWDRLQLERGEGAETNAADDWQTVLQAVHQKYSPDLRNAVDVQAVLTPEQFEAAQTVGLPRIANADKFDKDTPAAYRAARKAIA